MLLKLFTLLLVMLIFFNYPSIIFAEHTIFLKEEELKLLGFSRYEEINPNLQVYPFKRLTEKIKLMLNFSQEEKEKYRYQLLKIRFNELVYIINYNKTSFLLESVDRYNSFVGLVKQNGNLDASSKDESLRMLKILERLRDRYHSQSPYWAKIQQSLDTTRSLI